MFVLMNNPNIWILVSQGYAGGDEPKMLRRRLSDTSAKIGVGANRAAVAFSLLRKYGYIHHSKTLCAENKSSSTSKLDSGKIGVAILDDGMQVMQLVFCFQIHLFDSVDEGIVMVIYLHALLKQPFLSRQHWSLLRDVVIVMVNGLAPWGNTHFIPRGPMREPLSALGRADIVVIHNADLVSVVISISEIIVTLFCFSLLL